MLAVDTNVIVRIVTHDDPEQASRAVALFEREQIFIAKTVLLELEWVLRYAYRLGRPVIVTSMRKLIGLPNVTVESPVEVDSALDAYESGMDFADALHLFSSTRAGRFATFDAKLAKRAATLGAVDVIAV